MAVYRDIMAGCFAPDGESGKINANVTPLLPHLACEDLSHPLPENAELRLELRERQPGRAEAAKLANLLPGELGAELFARWRHDRASAIRRKVFPTGNA
jgi:hypothetical protein